MNGDVLCAADLARNEMAAACIAVPMTMAGLVVALSELPDGPDRSRLEDWYWALAIERYGEVCARNYRAEYEWLRADARLSDRETAA